MCLISCECVAKASCERDHFVQVVGVGTLFLARARGGEASEFPSHSSKGSRRPLRPPTCCSMNIRRYVERNTGSRHKQGSHAFPPTPSPSPHYPTPPPQEAVKHGISQTPMCFPHPHTHPRPLTPPQQSDCAEAMTILSFESLFKSLMDSNRILWSESMTHLCWTPRGRQ